MECVKCGAELKGTEAECPHCGVIVSKARPTPPSAEFSVASQARGGLTPARRFHYLVAPFHGQLRGGQGIEVVSSQLQELINHYGAHGWEFVQVGSVTLTVNQGCLASLFGAGTYQQAHDQVVFRKPVE